MKTLVILQSSYIPWKGYFDLIARSDEFVLYDDTQFTRRDWRNRNKIKTPHGSQWLTIPVRTKGKFEQLIEQVEVVEAAWAEQHWERISHAYAKAPYFQQYGQKISSLYEAAGRERMLSNINRIFLEGMCGMLGLPARFTFSREYPAALKKTDRLVDICSKTGATHYISGPAAKAYLDLELFKQAGIEVSYMSYEGYTEYPQLWGPFVHAVTMLDAIFNLGSNAPAAMLTRWKVPQQGG